MRQWARSHPRQPVICLVVGLFAVGTALQPQVEAIEREANRQSFVNEAMERGMTADMATCVADAMRREFGEDVFDAGGLELSPEDQQRQATLTTECATAEPGAPSDPPATAADECDTYARSVAARWGEVAEPLGASPTEVVQGIADTLVATADDAPSDLLGDVGAISGAARDYAEDLEGFSEGSASDDEVLEILAPLTQIDPDAQTRVWLACPDLDAHLGEEPTMIAALIFAIGGSQADMEDELRDCVASPDAAELGDNAGCDSLVRACESGVYEACDDIWVWSPVGSKYEAVGASCGKVIDRQHELYARGGCDGLG